jgi:hypothetical protein
MDIEIGFYKISNLKIQFENKIRTGYVNVMIKHNETSKLIRAVTKSSLLFKKNLLSGNIILVSAVFYTKCA